MKTLQFKLSRFLSHVKSWWVIVLLLILFSIITIIPLLDSCLGGFLVDMLSPVSLRGIHYGGSAQNGLRSSIAYALGFLFLSGLLIPFVTNHLRNLGEKYTNGTLDSYSWHNHILFLGYDELMDGTLCRMCQSKDIKRVVVAVPDGVASLRSKLQGMAGKNVEVVQCNQCDKNNLKKRTCIKKAKQIFIVGQPDDQTHDATNLATLGIVSTLRNKYEEENNDNCIPCMYYIRNQATFYLLQRHNVDAIEFKRSINDVGLVFDKEKTESFFLANEPFNVFESIARHLIIGSLSGVEGINMICSSEQTPHLIIIGMTPIGTAIARVAMMVAHQPGAKRICAHFIGTT